MPELPEVEVTRRALLPHALGQRVSRVTVRDHRLRWPIPADLDDRIRGDVVADVARRSKYLLWAFKRGTLISHLGMSGVWRILLRKDGVPPPRIHDHVDLEFEHVVLRLTDPRRFGALLWHPATAGPVEHHPLLAGLGLEPFDARFNGTHLYQSTRNRTASIKQVLLGGDVVVGVGNIYASEAMFRANINPKVPARRLGIARCQRLASAVCDVLTDAIGVGGSTLRDFVSAAGEEGYFMLDADVYGRAGQPCRVCGTPITRLIQGQRATFYCRHCQRR